MESKLQKNMVFPVVFSAVVILLLVWHISISYNYPYYFIHDMDYVTSLDLVLIQSDLRPDHICHPGFGMYLPLSFSQKIAHFVGAVSASDIDSFADSLNPLAMMAELTDFVRRHSPFLSVGIAVLLGLAIHRLFGVSRWYLLFFIVLLGTQESLSYHSSMVRTELYSVFYWSAAVWTTAMAVKADRAGSRWIYLAVTGILLGLCFLTKVQSLFYIAAVVVLQLVLFSVFRDDKEQGHGNRSRKGARLILAVSLFNVVVFLVLGIASYLVRIPKGVPVWAVGFGITPVVIVFISALVLLFLCQLFLYLTNRISSEIFRLSSFLSIVAAGFMVSFAAFFLLYSDAAVSVQHMLLSFKIAFLREPRLLHIPEASEYISNFLLYLRHNPTVFIVNIALSLFLILGCHFRFVQIEKIQVLLCLLVTVLGIAAIFVAARLVLRDTIWKEILLNFLSLFYFAFLVTRTVRYRRLLSRVGVGLLLVLFFTNCIHAYNMPNRLDAEVNYYGWGADRWFNPVYGGNQQEYGAIMQEKYNQTTAWIAKTKALEHKRIRKTVDFVFKNQAVTHRNIGIVFEGFGAWSTEPAYKIVEVPSALRGSILVDNASVELKRNAFFKKEYVRQESRYPYKIKKSASSKLLSVLSRSDLKIFLFVHAEDVPRLVSKEIVRTPYKILLQNSDKAIELQGLEINNYSEIPLIRIRQKCFFVIRKI